MKENKPARRLMVADGCKLALAIATNNGTVLCMLYGSMMGNITDRTCR